VTEVPAGDAGAATRGPDWDWYRAALLEADEAAAGGHAINDRCFALLRDLGVFRTLLPRELGGAEKEPLAAMALIEDLAALSGTLGWVSFVGVTGGMFAAELTPEAAREIYADPDALVAYAGAPAGALTRLDGGYRLTGRWEPVSGLSHATWVAVGCRILGEPGGPAVGIVPRRAGTVRFGWDPVGLSGTGTGALALDEVALPARRMLRAGARLDRRSTRYRTLVPSLMASVSLGLGRAALQETAAWLAAEPPGPDGRRRADSDQIQELLGRAYAEVRSARAFLLEVTAETWRRVCLGEDLGLEHGALHRLAASHAATVAAEVSSAVAALAGTRAVTRSHTQCRRWLDARTVTANVTVRSLYYQVYGGVAAGGAIPESWP
jgi:alkylation response protein AidB-like acyl-CoA dehydrogenase